MNILLVDDEVEICQSLATYLELDDHTVFTAHCADEALVILANEKIDLILSDVNMPMGDGKSLIKKMKEKEGASPDFIFMSGFTEMSKEESLELGAIDLLNKPIDFSLLDKIILERKNN